MKCCEFMKTKWGKVVKIAAFVLLLILVYGAGFNKGGYTTSYEESYYGGYTGSSYDDYYDYSEGEAKVTSESSISYDYYYDEVPTFGTSAVDVSQIDFTDAMIIKNGSLTMRVDSTNESVSAISELAKSLGGYVSYSSTYENYDGSMAGSVEFRVPADKFDDAMTGVKGMADVIDAESVDAQDVTEEYIDLEARLENKKSLEGQMQYYENQSSYSTITVYLSENITITTPAKDWRPVEVFKEAVSGWIVFLQEIVNFVIVVVVYLWIVPVVWVVVKIVRKMRKGRR